MPIPIAIPIGVVSEKANAIKNIVTVLNPACIIHLPLDLNKISDKRSLAKIPESSLIHMPIDFFLYLFLIFSLHVYIR